MPKLKNSKTATKRIKKITRNKKVIRLRMSAQHRVHGKSKKVTRKSKNPLTVTSADYKKIKKLIPIRMKNA